MLKLADTFINFPVMSLRAGGALGHVLYPVINPDNLKIEAWAVEDQYDKKVLYLLSKDIRETMTIGFAVNDHEVLTSLTDLVRLKPLVELKYDVIGKYLITENKQKLGKASDYAIDITTMEIKKIYYSKGILKGLVHGEASADRNQVIETTPKYIIVDDATIKVSDPKLSPIVSS